MVQDVRLRKRSTVLKKEEFEGVQKLRCQVKGLKSSNALYRSSS